MSSREFNQDTSGAKKASENGPVYITDRGRPAHVLLSFDAYEELVAPHKALDLLGEPAGVADIEFVAAKNSNTACCSWSVRNQHREQCFVSGST